MTLSTGPARPSRAVLPAPRLDQLISQRAQLSPLVLLRRKAPQPHGHQTQALVRKALASAPDSVREGATVAIGVGSRGIAEITHVVRACVDDVLARGGVPFIFPAMGSHGGATADGQEAVLAHLGVTHANVGAPIRSDMATVEVGTVNGVAIAVDAQAASADHVLLINRLKSHTSFSGQVESGLAKMLAVGMGKQRGAEELHRRGPAHLEGRIADAGKVIKTNLSIWGGLAIVETAHKTLHSVEFLSAAQIGNEEEAQLLLVAKAHEARLPFSRLDVLVVDLMGKDISGTGMDTNVLGRRMVRGMPELTNIDITNVVVLRVSPASHGNATGIGLADFMSARTLEDIDVIATYANALTAGLQGVQRAQLPVVLATDRDAVHAALLTSGVQDQAQIRLARIRSTLHLDEMQVTANLVVEAGQDFTDVTGGASLTQSCFEEDGAVRAWPRGVA